MLSRTSHVVVVGGLWGADCLSLKRGTLSPFAHLARTPWDTWPKEKERLSVLSGEDIPEKAQRRPCHRLRIK